MATRKTKTPEAKVYDARRPVLMTLGAQGDTVLEMLTRDLERMVERGQEQAADLVERLGNDPLRALEWSREAFDNAGRMRAAQRILEAVKCRLESGDEYSRPSVINVLRGIRETVFGEVLRGARSPARSTSQQSNLAEQAVLAAHAELLESLDGYLSWVA